jgi:phosphoglucomutase
MNMVTGKFTVTGISGYWVQRTADGNKIAETAQLTLDAQYDGTPEEQAFHKATPSGKITMQVDNPAALAELMKLGKKFYVTFTEAPEHAD